MDWPNINAALAGGGITTADLEKAPRCPRIVAGVGHEDLAVAGAADSRVAVEELDIADDVHDFPPFRGWNAVATATGTFFGRQFMKRSQTSQR